MRPSRNTNVSMPSSTLVRAASAAHSRKRIPFVPHRDRLGVIKPPVPAGTSIRPTASRRVPYIAFMRPMRFPAGSLKNAMVGPSGTSIGGVTVAPPALPTLSSASWTSGTAT